jgi:hypothetical protein
MHLSFVPVLINVRVLLSLLLLRRIRDGSAPTFAHDLRCQGIKSRAVMEHSAHWSRQLVCVLKRWEGSGVPVCKWRLVMLNSLVTTRLRGGAACLFPSRSATLVTPLPLLLLSMWCGSIYQFTTTPWEKRQSRRGRQYLVPVSFKHLHICLLVGVLCTNRQTMRK